MPDGLGKLLRKVGPFDGFTGRFAVIPVHTVVPGHFPQHHFRMLRKIAVQRYAILRFARTYSNHLDSLARRRAYPRGDAQEY